MELKINEKFKTVIPPLSAEEYNNLRDSIAHEGCRDAIIVWDGVIVDGHHRYAICTELNIPFNVSEITFGNEDAAVAWIMFTAIAKRNLSDVERGRLALKLKGVIAARAKENLKTSTGGAAPRPLPNLGKAAIDTQRELARIAGISHGNLAKIEMVDAEAPTVISDAMGTILSINKAALLTARLKELPEDERAAEAEAMFSIGEELRAGQF